MFATDHERSQRYEPIPPDLDEIEPGPVLAAFLWGIDVERVREHDRVVVLRAFRRMQAHYDARSWHAMTSIVDAYDPEGERQSDDVAMAATEVRVALTLTRRAADREVDFAVEMRERLPRVWRAVLEGRIDRRKARVLADGTLHLPDATARVVVDRIIDRAPDLTTGQIWARLRRLCIEADPDDARTRLERGTAERRVVVQPNPDGTAGLLGLGLAPDRATAAMERIDRIARDLRRHDRRRTIDQLRADVFCDLLVGAAHDGARAGSVELTVDLTTLMELDENPGIAAGYGPLIADIARRVAADQTTSPWRYTVRDPVTGDVHVGVTRRRPDADLRRRVEARYPTCVFPGCRIAASACDLDHRQAVADGGPTTESNLAPLCRHDHGARHSGWHLARLPAGDHRWTSPLGHGSTVRSEPP